MEAVVFDGKEYIKASVLAKRFRYTADYLGQLCRGKKVDARLVGRAWYINLDSLNDHRDGRYKPAATIKVIEKDATEEVLIHKKAPNNYLSRIEVEPILKKKTVSIFKNGKNGMLSEFPVKYESDEYSLIPKVNREAVSKEVHVYPAGAEIVKVHKEGSAATSFKAEELPEVFLKGTLKVAGLEEATEELVSQESKIDLETKPERKSELSRPKPVFVRPLKKRSAAAETPEKESAVKVTISIIKTPPKIVSPQAQNALITQADPPTTLAEPKKLLKVLSEPEKIAPSRQKSALQPLKITLAPKATVSQTSVPASFKPRLVVKKEQKKIAKAKSSPGWLLPIFIISAACIFAVASVAVNVEIVIIKSGYHFTFMFDWSQFQAAVSQLKNI